MFSLHQKPQSIVSYNQRCKMLYVGGVKGSTTSPLLVFCVLEIHVPGDSKYEHINSEENDSKPQNYDVY